MLVESLYTDRGDVQVVNVRNAGAIPNVDDDAVVEVACRISASGAEPLPVDPLAPEMLGLVEQLKAYERLTGEPFERYRERMGVPSGPDRREHG